MDSAAVIVWMISPPIATVTLGLLIKLVCDSKLPADFKKITAGWGIFLLVILWAAFILRWLFTDIPIPL